MASTFFGLQIAASGMATYNAHLNVTAHNIANAKTEGYSKQSANQIAKNPISLGTSYGMIGSGSEITDITSSRDEYYDYKYRKSNAVLGYYDTASYYMKSIEDYLYSNDKESAGLSNSLNKFFDTLTSLTRSPGDTTIRTEATGYADTLAQYANEMVRSLQQMQNDINIHISTTVEQINAYAEQISSLTRQINTLSVFNGTPNDLIDQRARLVDELSALADIEIVEQPPADGNGVTQYIINLGGGILVDTYNYNKLITVPQGTSTNQGDVDGLYSIKWSNGQDFAIRNTKLGGQLQALLEIRDGNNGENFRAKFEEYSAVTGKPSTFTMTAAPSSSETASSLAKLNIPASNGVITVGNYEFQYDSFSVAVAADGTYTYTFTLSKELSADDKANIDRIQGVATGAGKDLQANIGDAVEYRGIPYYISQLNEFVRTFSATFNQQQNRGYDLYGNKGSDLFMAKDITSAEQLNMTEFLKNTTDGYYYLNGDKVFTSDDYDTYITRYSDTNKYTIKANTPDVTISGTSYTYMTVTDKEGNIVENIYKSKAADTKYAKNTIFTFNSLTSAGESASYYNMTASSFSVNEVMVKNGRYIAAAARDPKGEATGTVENSGVEEAENLELLANLQSDTTMFKQGDPISFIQVMTATVGVDSKKVISSAENAQDIVEAVDNRRLSTAGVDEDEEGQMLIEAQNLLNIQYRVISVMNETLNKLINEMGA